MKWVSNTLVPGIEKSEEEKIMFADNASFQCAQKFHEKCRGGLNTVVYLLPSNHTDKVQPVDAGFGNEIRRRQEKIWRDGLKNMTTSTNGMISYLPGKEGY